VVSKCLGFEACRYNAQSIPSPIVERLNPHVEYVTTCPEVEIGLGVPRKPVRIVDEGEGSRVVQPETGRDVTDSMVDYSRKFLDGIGEVDGVILKSRSPSCGLRDTKIYPGTGKVASIGRGPGMFGKAVLERLGELSVEDEARLQNPLIREHFLKKLFTLRRFRDIRGKNSMKALIRFHSEHKYMLMGYNQAELREMGRVVANPKKRPTEEVIAEYGRHLTRAMAKAARCSSNINVLMHALGHVSEGLSAKEKAFFLDSLQAYKEGHVSVSVPTNIMKSWVIRFEEPYLEMQAFFEPYPEALVDVQSIDACRARDYWK
jgi:uncharacterized protein YbgA (DUF1722 family)/uncharacterized protein YbbK (DUF523 family)